MHYDTLIIGAGLSGLAAGIRCAYFDQRVCVLERHTTIGRLNSFYRLRGQSRRRIACCHKLCLSSKTGPLSKLLRQLRIRWDEFAAMPGRSGPPWCFGVTLKFTNDFEYLREQQVHNRFPLEKDRFERFHSHLLTFNELDLNQQAVSAREIVRKLSAGPLLIDMLFCPLMFYGGTRPDDMDWNQFVVMYKSIFLEGFARPNRESGRS
ncbi:MAG: FAD-binding protein [Planctomycetaceae bacterium]